VTRSDNKHFGITQVRAGFGAIVTVDGPPVRGAVVAEVDEKKLAYRISTLLFRALRTPFITEDALDTMKGSPGIKVSVSDFDIAPLSGPESGFALEYVAGETKRTIAVLETSERAQQLRLALAQASCVRLG
jgi:hypothetical protein